MPFGKRLGRDRKYYALIRSVFGITPSNIELYKLALVHRSASQHLADGSPVNNERLEFLGDAVLESIVSDYLFIEYPQMNEGSLTQLRSKIVSRTMLNDLCVKIGLSPYIISNGGSGSGHKHLHGDALEAIIGALYLDKGYDTTNRVVIGRILNTHLDLEMLTYTETDFKSRLIEWCQKSKHGIHFNTAFGEGSSSQHPVFRAVAVIDDMEMAFGLGSSKKEAEQRAAYSVLQVLNDETGDNILEMMDISRERAEAEMTGEPGEPAGESGKSKKPGSRSKKG